MLPLYNSKTEPYTYLDSALFHKKKIGWQADKRYKFFDERDEDDDQYLGSEYWSILHTKQLYNLFTN